MVLDNTSNSHHSTVVMKRDTRNQVRLTKDQLISELHRRLNLCDSEQLSDLSEILLGVRLNHCGSSLGSLFITCVNMLNDDSSLYRYIDLQHNERIKAIAHDVWSISRPLEKKRSALRVALLKAGVQLTQLEFAHLCDSLEANDV